MTEPRPSFTVPRARRRRRAARCARIAPRPRPDRAAAARLRRAASRCSRSHNAASCSRSSSSTGLVSRSTNFRSATPISRSGNPSRVRRLTPRDRWHSVRSMRVRSRFIPASLAAVAGPRTRRVFERRRRQAAGPTRREEDDHDQARGNRADDPKRSPRRRRSGPMSRSTTRHAQAVLDGRVADVRRRRGARAARRPASVGTGYAALFDRVSRTRAATGPTERALTDEAIGKVDGNSSTTASPVAVSGLADAVGARR